MSTITSAAFVAQHSSQVLAAACTTPPTDYGQVSNISVAIDTAATYRIWSRMAAADSSNNTYLLEIDGNTCFNVGGSSVPVYAGGSTTRFAANSTNWIATTATGSAVSLNLSVGTHTIKLIGNAPNVVIDRLIVTSDMACTPTGTGDNCVIPADSTAPTLSSIAAGSVTSNGAIISWTTNELSDTQVVYGTTSGYGLSSTLAPTQVTSHSVTLNGLTGSTTYHYAVKSRDAAGNLATSTDKTFTTLAQTYIAADINQDGRVNILDISLMINKWNQTTSLGRNDINSSGKVDALDLSLLIAHYGE
ncbi:MAG TPA: dockerin type I domain-containing protein [Candidatus Saccharimonadales bacterium]